MSDRKMELEQKLYDLSRRVASHAVTDVCEGCGCEHNCLATGQCAIIREAMPAVRAGAKPATMEWIPTGLRLPPDYDVVLCAVNGKYGDTMFIDGVLFGTYSAAEGWILEAYPEWENPTVSFWLPIPLTPAERME